MADQTRTPTGIASAQAIGSVTTLESIGALYAFGQLRLDGAERANGLQEPDALGGVLPWEGWSWPLPERVTSAPVPLPAGARSAFKLTSGPGDGGCCLESERLPLPGSVVYGDWVAIQAEVYVEGVDDAECALQFCVDWRDEDGYGLNPSWVDLVNAAMWIRESPPYPPPYLGIYRDTMLPLDGFVRYSAVLQVPSDLTYYSGSYHKHITEFQVTVAVYDMNNGSAADTAVMYATNLSVEPSSEYGEVPPFGWGQATLGTATVVEDAVVASSAITLDGQAYLSLLGHGEESLVAHGYIHTGSTAQLGDAGNPPPPLPPMPVWDTGTTDLQGLSVKMDGYPLKRAQIGDLAIELDREGGPLSCSMTVASNLKRAPKLLDPLVITYKGQTLFRGRLESIATALDASAGYDLLYGGPMTKLRDHKAFRLVVIDTDLDNIQTDQGARTSPDTYDVVSRTSGVS